MFVFRKFGVLYFFETPVLRFALLPYYRPFHIMLIQQNFLTTEAVAERLLKIIHKSSKSTAQYCVCYQLRTYSQVISNLIKFFRAAVFVELRWNI